MNAKVVEMISRVDGSKRQVGLAVCECQNETFYILSSGENELHIQCDNCSMMYCRHEGTCNLNSGN